MSRGSRFIRLSISAVCLVSLSACFTAYDEHIVARYRLFAPDTEEQMCLLWDYQDHSGPCVIQPTVFAVGFDDKHLVAESHPNGNRASNAFWYIIRDKRSESSPPAMTHVQLKGPFSKQQYASIKAKLRLPEFTTVLTNLE